ncbi:Uncharacterised protein [Klebsiella pneumoniae]|uniref:hypothetical protein n=1 Tax=Klebsiella pneumoniae TaxID=573 RepID=UPI0010D4255B|nr:hypothetical protein [Klebsiella pneumoniae]VGD35167.1 Uncharacterised protein [Klebsiella pneumoniae]
MTTDITELAQSEINDALAQLKQISEYPTPSTQYARVLRKYIATLVEALEKAQRYIEELREWNAGLAQESCEYQQRIAELESFHTAYMEWSDKTDWVQTDKRFGVVKPLGKHRADVLKEYIQHLESRTMKLPAERFCPAEYAGSQLWSETEVWNKAITACADALRAAGIKVEAE